MSWHFGSGGTSARRSLFDRLPATALFVLRDRQMPSNSLDLNDLQQEFAAVDMLTRKPTNARSDLLEVLLLKHERIKLKMYQELGHARPHFHVDYGRQSHTASYAIDTGERIEGDLPKKYDKAVSDWALRSQGPLLSAWNDLQAGSTGGSFISSLPAMK